MVEEDRSQRRPIPAIPTLLEENGPAVGEIRLERRARRATEEADPLLPALPEDPELTAAKVERRQVRRRELADPEAGGIGGLDDRPIAERDRDPDRHAGAAVARRRDGGPRDLIHSGEQPLDLLDLEDPREPSWQTGRRDRSPWVAGREALAGDEPVEGPDRGETLGCGAAGPPHPENGEIGPEIAAARRAPVHAARRQPVEIRRERRCVGPLGMRGGIPRCE